MNKRLGAITPTASVTAHYGHIGPESVINDLRYFPKMTSSQESHSDHLREDPINPTHVCLSYTRISEDRQTLFSRLTAETPK